MSSGRPVRARRAVPPVPGSSAVLVATAALADGAPAALQPWEGETLLSRLVAQLSSLGIARLHVLTRPAWADAIRAAADGAELHAGESAADDLRAIGRIAESAPGPLVVAYADVVTQREVLAGLLQEPRIRTGILTTGGTVARPYGFKTRARRGRIVSAGSPYHAVRKPTGTFLGVIKIAPADRPGVAPVAQRLAALVDPPDAGLAGGARLQGRPLAADARAVLARPRARRAGAAARGARRHPAHARGRRRARAPARDRAGRRDRAAARRARALERAHHRFAPALAVLGPPRLAGRAPARRGRHPRARRGPRAAQLGGQGIGRLLHDVLRLDLLAVHRALGGAARADAQPGDAVLDRARRRRRRLLRGRASAGPWSWARVLVYFAFVFDCVDGQLARYTRQFSKLGAWLDSIFDRSKEYVVFAGLAIGASRTGDPVWLLAGAALALQTTRHAIDFSYPVSQHQVIAETPQPPLEDPFDVPRPASRLTEPVETEEVEEEDAEALPPVPARPTLKQRAARLWRATDRGPHALGQEDHPVPDRRALRRDRDHRRVLRRAHRLHRPARLGRLRGRLRPARPHARGRWCHERRRDPLRRARRPSTAAACSTPTATTGRSRPRSGALLGAPHRAAADRVAARGRAAAAARDRHQGRRRVGGRSWPAWWRGRCCWAGSPARAR